jgi:hypothetical protein
VAIADKSKPLLAKLLAVPALRQQYLGYVRDIAVDETAGPGRAGMSIKSFADQRRAYLLNHAGVR